MVTAGTSGAFRLLFGGALLEPGDSYGFCLRMLAEAGVAATPGVDFGRYRTHQYVRFAYTRSVADIREGVRRLQEWIPTVSPPR